MKADPYQHRTADDRAFSAAVLAHINRSGRKLTDCSICHR